MKRSIVYRRLQFLVKGILPGIYVLYATGVFENGLTITDTSVRAGVPIAIGFILYRMFSDIKARAKDTENLNYSERALGKSLGQMTPWIIILTAATLIYLGVASVYQHLAIISGLQVIGGIFVYKQWYWTYEERNPQRPQKELV